MDKIQNKKLNIEEYRSGETVLKSLPQVVYIETTNTCNLHCPICPITMGVKEYIHSAKFFSWENFLKILPLIKTAQRCIMSGGGEPLLHPRFFDMVKAVKECFAQVIFNTNGTLLDKEKAETLVELQADTLSISIDGATPKTYEKLRVGASFKVLRENIRALNQIKLKAKSEKPYINIQMTITKANYTEIPAMVELAGEWGINHLVIEPLTPVFCEDVNYKNFFDENMAPPSLVADYIRKAKISAQKKGIVFSSHYLVKLGEEKGFGPAKLFRCVQPWINIGFRTDGTIFPCCGTSFTLGNLVESEDLLNLWNSIKYINLRKAFKEFNAPPFCSLCLEEGRALHFNEDLVEKGIYKN